MSVNKTPNLQLNKPGIGDTNWGGDVNDNWDIIDAAAGGSASNPNRLINSNFAINQRGYTSGSALAIGAFGHDRWKAITASSYTFTQGTALTTVTITGTIAQIVEAAAIQGGSYVLSWTGTATATVNGTAISSGGTIAISAGTQTTVAFSNGTLSNPKLEFGSTATAYQVPDPQQEMARCYRYYQKYGYAQASLIFTGYGAAGGGVWGTMSFPAMRVAPTASMAGTWTLANMSSASPYCTATNSVMLTGMIAAAGVGYFYCTNTSGLTLDAEI